MKYYYESITPAHLIGKPMISKEIPKLKKVAYFKSLDNLNTSIKKYFGCFEEISNLNNQNEYLKDIAENFKIKLICENYNFCTFPARVGNSNVYVTYKLEIEK